MQNRDAIRAIIFDSFSVTSTAAQLIDDRAETVLPINFKFKFKISRKRKRYSLKFLLDIRAQSILTIF